MGALDGIVVLDLPRVRARGVFGPSQPGRTGVSR